MCMFTGTVKNVQGTRILVCQTCQGRQLTCYQNIVTLEKQQNDIKGEQPKPVMILPFPNTDKSRKLEFIDLSQTPDILERLETAFPKIKEHKEFGGFSFSLGGGGQDNLKTVQVGSYICSVALNLADLRRVDPKVFRVSDRLVKVLEEFYAKNFGFVICKLVQGGKQHPIAYVHDLAPENSGTLFVPTRHEHGHGGEENAEWDHFIYSCNTKDMKTSGPSIKEYAGQLFDQLAHKAKTEGVHVAVLPGQSDKLTQYGVPHWALEPPGATPNVLLSLLPRSIGVVVPTVFRRLRIEGTHPNGDLFLPVESSSQSLDSLFPPLPVLASGTLPKMSLPKT